MYKRQIETYADRLLAEVGIEIRDDAEALQMFRDAGATVDLSLIHISEPTRPY